MADREDRVGQEEFVWAMQSLTCASDEEILRERRIANLSALNLEDFLPLQKTDSVISNNDTKMLCSLLPDVILVAPNNFTEQHLEAAIVVAEIVDFSLLWEKYRTLCKGGPKRMTSTLNAYVGRLMHEALVANGDIISYNGNNVMVAWKQTSRTMGDCVHLAVDYALSFMKSYGKFDTDMGLPINIKFAITCGMFSFSLLGTSESAHYIIFGPPLESVRQMLERIDINCLILNAEAWEHLNNIEYMATLIDMENQLYMVTDFSKAWRSIQETSDRPMGRGLKNEPRIAYRKKPTEGLTIYDVRPSVRDIINMNTSGQLKKFLLPPLVSVVDVDDTLDVLCEIRHMVLMCAAFVIEPQEYSESLKIISEIYNKVCKILDVYAGYIYSMEYTENELNYMIVFGIRGKRETSESRNGLVAAIKCFKAMDPMATVTCASISVVTGLVYCGIIGDPFRKSYVIIGPKMNKVKKLMAAFPNKVTCDCDTFLQSKLEARHFVLLDHHHPSDVVDTAPTYEYVEYNTPLHFAKVETSKNPLLDRTHEMELFHSMVVRFQEPPLPHPALIRFQMMYEPSGLFILGEPRQGKTRLLEEMSSMTPSGMQTFRICLSEMDKSIPYQTVFLMLSIPMGITAKSTPADRKAKLTSMLHEGAMVGLVSLLNEVFRVDFHGADLDATLSQRHRKVGLKKLIGHLCSKCFSTPWIIFIDDGQYIDSESWDLIYTILETHTVFVVCAIRYACQNFSEKASHYISAPKSICRKLLPIRDRYQGSVACQMLGTVGIPIVLERILHERSAGNPGWIQNCILSLVHSNSVVLRKVTNMDDYKDLLIFPPADHLARKNLLISSESYPSTTLLTVHHAALMIDAKLDVMGTFTNVRGDLVIVTQLECNTLLLQPIEVVKEVEPPIIDITTETSGWMLKDTSQSMTRSRLAQAARKFQLQSIEAPDHHNHRRKRFTVCILKPECEQLFGSDNIETLYVSKVMDRLYSMHLTVLKAASIIGDFFLREMLLFIMGKDTEKNLAQAIQQLFEIGVIGCAEGDFSKAMSRYAPLMSRHFKTYINQAVECNCIQLKIPDDCVDLPKYASCGFMRFKDKKFRLAVYNMLTSEQIVDMHKRAFTFLMKRCRKCNSCGGDAFTDILGNNYEEGVLARKQQSLKSSANQNKTRLSMILDVTDENRTLNLLQARTRVGRLDGSGIFNPFIKSALNGEEGRTERVFDYYDLTMCECKEILRSMYFYIRKHCILIGEYEKWMNATIEYSFLCADDHNHVLALKLLRQALNVLNSTSYKKFVREGELWKLKAMKGRILAEIGRAKVNLGRPRSAFTAFEHALRQYGYQLPKPSAFRSKVMEWKQYLLLSWRRGIGSKFGYVAQFYDSVSNCLHMLTGLFITLELWRYAYTTAMWSLKLALESEKCFITLMNAFSRMIYVCCRMQKYSVIDTLELLALDYCRRYRATVELNDLKTVTELYTSIFHWRIRRGNYLSAISIAGTLDKLTEMLHLRYLLIPLFALYFEVLLIRMEMSVLVNAMNVFVEVCRELTGLKGEVWLYAMRIYFHLQTGYMMGDMDTCVRFYVTQRTKIVSLHDSELQRRFFVSLWLWYVRTGNYELADLCEKNMPSRWVVGEYDSLSTMVTSLMYIEGQILLVAFRVDRGAIFVIERMYRKIGLLLSKMEAHTHNVKIIGPRLFHLKAFFCMCKAYEDEGRRMLQRSLTLARNTQNFFDAAWTQHSERAWRRDMSQVEVKLWKDHAMDDDTLMYHELNVDDPNLLFYTLELPLYV